MHIEMRNMYVSLLDKYQLANLTPYESTLQAQLDTAKCDPDPHPPRCRMYLFPVDADIAEGVDGDQDVANIGVDLAGPVALLQLRHDHLLRQPLQGGQVVDEHGRQLRLAARL